MSKTTLAGGLIKEVLRAGSGPTPPRGANITVHCTGYLDSGKKFWSTKDPGQQTFSFKVGLGQVIKGWDEGCMTMQKGEVARLTVPGPMAYGPQGFPAWGIGPNATLTFEIEVLDF
ncbi:FKBP-type peptidyl-prolyl cis-trans isomerase [Salpingoeca rosetta]|uniref:peptidylprolyl isomerase n=1 Tax=Salpingoeca rosetta (strain ATCC 50818 / BSB-021) TaxID=946362 RepID=F2UPF5_SALR5|nr:FKBP-type peptidyl-prolyl cis-trans isomerase [Salpingoeca rosetta]EGD79510.1 FKBP-type peptidyl-prolyl cis-trans isomerase [Salpingoeca rosetta]|eukprot:XP_004988991.1 FKBP-type peptidyl-prolyl cis-trans isomerase [Salpingoeca rosetta]